MFTFSKKDSISTPLIENQDDDDQNAAAEMDKMPQWLKFREEMEDEATSNLRRQVQLNYKKYSIAEDQLSKITVLNRQTGFEKMSGVDLELFGTKDTNIVNEFIYKYGDGQWWYQNAVRRDRARKLGDFDLPDEMLLNNPLKYANRDDNILRLRVPHNQTIVVEEAGFDERQEREEELQQIKDQVPEDAYKDVQDKLEKAKQEKELWEKEFENKVKATVEQQLNTLKQGEDQQSKLAGLTNPNRRMTTTFKADGTFAMELEQADDDENTGAKVNMKKISKEFVRLKKELEKQEKDKNNVEKMFEAKQLNEIQKKEEEDKIDAIIAKLDEDLFRIMDEFKEAYPQDPNFIMSLRCDSRQQMFLTPKNASALKDATSIQNECRMCGQEAVLFQEDGHYACYLEECEESFRFAQHTKICSKLNKDGTPVDHKDEDCTRTWKKYLVCRACAMTLKSENPLTMRVKLSVHEHELERHSNMYTGHWGCACSSKDFKEKITKQVKAKLKKKYQNLTPVQMNDKIQKYVDKELKCKFKDKVITDWRTSQGYGCKECEFHFCLMCMERFRQKDIEKAKKKKEEEGQAREEGEVHEHSDEPEVNVAIAHDPHVHEHGHTHGHGLLRDDKFFQNIKDLNMEAVSVPSIGAELYFIEGKKPLQGYNDKMADFAEQILKKRNLLFKHILNVSSYHLTEDDEKNMFDTSFMDKETYPEHAVLYQIKKKEIQFVKDPKDTEQFSVVIKTIEQTSKDLHIKEHCNPHNLVKTLRVWQFDLKADRFVEKAAILLEQVPGHEYEEENGQFYQISVIHNNYKLYFWRRRKSNEPGRWEMQLWSYDLRDKGKANQENVPVQVKFENFSYHDEVDKVRKNLFSESLDPFTHVCPTFDELLANHEQEQFQKWCLNYDAYWRKIDEEKKKNKGKKKLSAEEEKELYDNQIKDEPQFKMEEFMCGTGQPHFQFASVLLNPFPLDMEGMISPEQLQIKKEEKNERLMYLEKFRAEILEKLDEHKAKEAKQNKSAAENQEHNGLNENDLKYFENLDGLQKEKTAIKNKIELGGLNYEQRNQCQEDLIVLEKIESDQSASKYKYLKAIWDDLYKDKRDMKEEFKFLNSQFVLKQYYYPCKVYQNYLDSDEFKNREVPDKSPKPNILDKVIEHKAARESLASKATKKVTQGLKKLGGFFGFGDSQAEEEAKKKEEEEKKAKEELDQSVLNQTQIMNENDVDDKEEKKEGEEDEEDDVQKIKEQEFRIYQMDKIKNNSEVKCSEIQKITNKKSKVPIIQFFVKIIDIKEDKYDEREMKMRSIQGLEQEYRYFRSIQMVLFDSKAYEVAFDTKRAEDYEDQTKPAPKMLIRNIPNTGLTRWINDPSEVQYLKIDKPGMSLLQYYVLTTRPTQLDPSKRQPYIKLISPVIHKNKQITKEIKDEIIKYLNAQNGYQNQGRQIITYSNYKGRASDNNTVVHCRRLNNEFLDSLIKNCSNIPYWEEQNFSYENLSSRLEKARVAQGSSSGETNFIRINFMNLTYREQMWINSVGNNSPIEVYTCYNNFQQSLEAKINPKDKEQRLKFNSDTKHDQLYYRDMKEIWDTVISNQTSVVFRNSSYKRILYTFNKIKFMLEETEKKKMHDIEFCLNRLNPYDYIEHMKKLKEKSHGHAHEHEEGEEHSSDDSDSEDTEDDYGDEDDEEEEPVLDVQDGDVKEWPLNQLQKHFVEINENDKANTIYIEDRRPDKRYPGRIKRVQIIDLETKAVVDNQNQANEDDDEEDTNITVTAISYYRSEENYCFLMKLNNCHHFFFIKKNDEIFNIGREVGNEKIKPLLSDYTKVYYLYNLRETIQTTFSKLKKSLAKINYLIEYDGDSKINNWSDIDKIHSNYKAAEDKFKINPYDEDLETEFERYTRFSIGISVEKVVDQLEKTDFFPFVSCKTDYETTGEVEHRPAKFVNFNIFSFTEQSHPNQDQRHRPDVRCSIPISVPEGVSIDTCSNHIKMCKSSDMQTDETILDNGQDNFLQSWKRDYGSKQEKMLRQRQCRFMIGFLFTGGAHRMIFKEIQINSKIQLLRVGTNMVLREVFDQEYHIYQVGQRELIASRQETSCYNISDFQLLPFIDETDGCVIGTQLLLTNFDKKIKNKDKAWKNQQFQLLTMLDCEQEGMNNLFQYESAVGMFGYQKFFNGNKGKNKEFENACYYLLTSVRIRQRAVMQANLDTIEILTVLREFIDNLCHLAPFTLRSALTEDFESLKSRIFFHQQEVLLGQSMMLLHMNDLDVIRERMKSQAVLLVHQYTLLEECVRGDPARIEKLVKDKRFKRQLRIINCDFNYHSEVEKAFNLGEFSAQKLMLESCLNLDTDDYGPMFMQFLGFILRSEDLQGEENDANANVEFILPFVSRRPGISSTQQFCNIEKFMFSSLLPLKSDKEQEWQEFAAFEDGNRIQTEMITKICHNDEVKKQENKEFAVEHSYIDWTRTILAFKLERYSNGQEPEEVYGKRFFASLMVQEDIQFYVQDEIQKFIDFQFAETQQFFLINLCIYIFLFIVPFLIIVFKVGEDSRLFQNGAMLSCLCTQNYFIAWEILQMKRDGFKDYFSSFRNWTELGQFLMFLVVFAREFLFSVDSKKDDPAQGGDNDAPAWMKLMIMLIITQAFLKILFFLKIFSQYGFLVQMVFSSIVNVAGFLSFFMMWLIFFSLQYANLNVYFSPDGYEGVPTPIIVLLSTFRNSIGDLQIMKYKNEDDPSNKDYIQDFDRHDWMKKADEYNKLSDTKNEYLCYLMIFLLWTFWFANIALQNVILMNFLVAVIGDSYVQINEAKVQYIYKDKADMNLECQDLKSLLFPQKELKAVSFSLDKTKFSAAKDPQEDIKNAVKESVVVVKDDIIVKVDEIYGKLQDQIEEMSAGAKKGGASATQAAVADEEEELGIDELALAETKASTEMLKNQSEVLGNQADEIETIRETLDVLASSIEKLHSKQDNMRQQAEKEAEKQSSYIQNLKKEVSEKFTESQKNTDSKFEEASKSQSKNSKENEKTVIDSIQQHQKTQIDTIQKTLIESINKTQELSVKQSETQQQQLNELVAGLNQLKQDQEQFKQQQQANQFAAIAQLMEQQLQEMKKVRDEAQANTRAMLQELQKQ